VASAIAKALSNLGEALAELEKIPAFDARSAAFAAHALNNYQTVTTGTVELLQSRLANHPDDELRAWLEGTQHANKLMARLVEQLTNTAAQPGAPLQMEWFDLPTLVQRACRFFQRWALRRSPRQIARIMRNSRNTLEFPISPAILTPGFV
jgi:hypothetical protein